MAYKERSKSKELLIYEALAKRMRLITDDYYYLRAMQKGYEGECQFDEYTKKLKSDVIILNDLALKDWRKFFQIDALIVTGDAFFLYEVKNYEGEYRWTKERLIKSNGTKIENPLLNLDTKRVKLEIYLEKMGYTQKVHAFVVYINPEFTLVNPEEGEQYLLRSQLTRHLKTLDQQATPVENTHLKLASRLVEQHDSEHIFQDLPEYEYGQLKKAITCLQCGSLATSIKGKTLHCNACWGKAAAETAIRNSIEEYRLLFPKERLSTRRMMEWCGQEERFRIYRTLQKHWTPLRKGPHRYYV